MDGYAFMLYNRFHFLKTHYCSAVLEIAVLFCQFLDIEVFEYLDQSLGLILLQSIRVLICGHSLFSLNAITSVFCCSISILSFCTLLQQCPIIIASLLYFLQLRACHQDISQVVYGQPFYSLITSQFSTSISF